MAGAERDPVIPPNPPLRLPPATPLGLHWRRYRFGLPRQLRTARGTVAEREGWLLRLEGPDGRLGWGEAAPLESRPPASRCRDGSGAAVAERFPQAQTAAALREIASPATPGWVPAGEALRLCREAIEALGPTRRLQDLEAAMPRLPAPVAFALGAALAELQGLVGDPFQRGEGGGWLAAPASAWLLPAGEAALEFLERCLPAASPLPAAAEPPLGAREASVQTFKWKVAAFPDRLERAWLEPLLQRLPAVARLRLDANGGWDRCTAAAWAERLAGEPRLEWLEQPLAAADLEGLTALAARLPVALDESLAWDPSLRERWPGWQVRRPALEGDPRPLLQALRARSLPRCMLSTAFETGIGRRWLGHLAALQVAGPTPAAPGLAPGWLPEGELFAADPLRCWRSLAEAAR